MDLIAWAILITGAYICSAMDKNFEACVLVGLSLVPILLTLITPI